MKDVTYDPQERSDDAIAVVWPGEAAHLYEWCRDTGHVTTGWFWDESMAGWTPEVLERRFRERYRIGTPKAGSGKPWDRTSQDIDLRQLHDFLFEMDPGRLVATAPEGSREVLLGTVSGPYEFADPVPVSYRVDPYRHVKKVVWFARIPAAAAGPAMGRVGGRHRYATVRWVDEPEEVRLLRQAAEQHPFVGRSHDWQPVPEMDPTLRRELLDNLESSRPSVQISAAEALAAVGDEQALEALRLAESLSENDRLTRAIARAITRLEERLRQGATDPEPGQQDAPQPIAVSWNRQQLILALDLWARRGNVAEDDPELIDLTQTLGRVGAARSADALAVQVREFAALSGGRGDATPGGANAAKIFDEMAEAPGLGAIAEAIAAEPGVEYDADLLDRDALTFPEGRLVFRLHASRERNQDLVREKKMRAAGQGALECEVCGFIFAETYEISGADTFIECHHKTPISLYEGEAETRLDELALVCSNCHRMLHVQRPWLSIEELRLRLKMGMAE